MKRPTWTRAWRMCRGNPKQQRKALKLETRKKMRQQERAYLHRRRFDAESAPVDRDIVTDWDVW